MYHGGLKKGSETWSYNGSAQGHMMKELKSDLETRGQIFISTWPSMFLGIYGDHIRIVRLISKGPEQMELTVEWLFDENTLKDPKYDKTNVVDFAILVMEQDASISEVNQRGLYNLQNSQGVLMPEEYMIRDFQKYINAVDEKGLVIKPPPTTTNANKDKLFKIKTVDISDLTIFPYDIWQKRLSRRKMI